MDIMDMTLRQILQQIPLHPVKDMAIALIVDNVLASACAAAGWTKGETFFLKLSKFVGAILAALAKKAGAVAPKTTSTLLIIIPLALMSGCASAVMKSGCGHINGAEVTIPYVGGKANGNAYGCYVGCFGPGCKAVSDYSALATITAEYIKDASKDNAIQTTSAGTITFIPASK